MATSCLRLGAVVDGHGAGWLQRFASSVTWAADGARSPASWLDAHSETSKIRAGSLLKRARTLPGLPAIGVAFSAGTLGDEKIRLLLAAHKRLPDKVVEH